jgi:hypothetical protein
MIGVESRGNFDTTKKSLERLKALKFYEGLDGLARKGVRALSSATPVDTGLAATSWGYKIDVGGQYTTISWTNDDVEGGISVVILLQYGHGTGTGGYVAGRDFINPAIRPIFDDIAGEVWKKVVNA